MDVRAELKEIAKNMERALQEYSVIHQKVFGFSVQKLFFPAARVSVLKDLEREAERSLGHLRKDVERLKYIERHAEKAERLFAENILPYGRALEESFVLLGRLIVQLGFQSGQAAQYDLSEHNRLSEEYNVSISILNSMGPKMQRVYQGFESREGKGPVHP